MLDAARYRCGAAGVVCLIVCLLSARCCQVQVWCHWSCLSHRLSPQCSVLPGTGVVLLELSVSSSVCSMLGAARYRCVSSYWSCLSHRLSAQCSILPGTGVELVELSVSSSVCSVLGAARYRCGASGVVCFIARVAVGEETFRETSRTGVSFQVVTG